MGRDGFYIVCAGSFNRLLGHTLWLLIYTDILRPVRGNRGEIFWDMVEQICSEHEGTRHFHNIDATSFCDPSAFIIDYPMLGGKAGGFIHLVCVFAGIWVRHHRPHIKFEQRVHNCLQHVTKFHAIFETSSDNIVRFFSGSFKCNDFQQCIAHVLGNYFRLTHYYFKV